jgi:hypothetical protein
LTYVYDTFLYEEQNSGGEIEMPKEERDFLSEVREQVEAYLDTHEDGLVPGIAAGELGEKWEATDPKLLRGWLMLRWQGFLTDYISMVSRSRSARAGRASVHRVFGEFAEDFQAAGDPEAQERSYKHWYGFYEVTAGEGKVRKAMHRLTSGELKEVAAGYQRRSDENAFYARIITAIQRKVDRAGPDKTVGDVYTQEALERMFERQ